MGKKEVFEIIVGISNIGAFLISIIALRKVSEVKKIVNKSNRIEQTIENTDIRGKSRVTQVGGDLNKGE